MTIHFCVSTWVPGALHGCEELQAAQEMTGWWFSHLLKTMHLQVRHFIALPAGIAIIPGGIITKKREKNNNTTRHKKSFPDEDTVQFKCDCGLPSIEIDFLPAGGTRTFSKPAHWWHCQLTTRSVLTSSERFSSKNWNCWTKTFPRSSSQIVFNPIEQATPTQPDGDGTFGSLRVAFCVLPPAKTRTCYFFFAPSNKPFF